MLTFNDSALALETAFGDPGQPGNPVGAAAILEADERGQLLAAGEQLLDREGLNAEFVPEALGGRLTSLDGLTRSLRPVFRRDVTLGLGYGVTSFMGAVNVWAAGDADQQRRLADILLAGGKVSVAYHELAHGNDFLRNDLRGRLNGGRLALTGVKQVINNIERADALLVFARTDDAPGGRSHSVLLLEREDLDPERIRILPRYATGGVQGCRIAGIEFMDCPVGALTAVGGPGAGAEVALRSFQVTRAALPGMAVGVLDTALRTVLGFAVERRLYGTTVSALPHARSVLTAAFADTLVADCLARTAARGLHVIPGEGGALSAATKYLVPQLVGDQLYELSRVLGARFYVRDGEHAMFQKLVRDAPVLSLGHAGSAACLATLLPQLPGLARRAWGQDADPPRALFDLDEPLGPLRFDALSLSGGRADTVLGALDGGLAELAAAAPGADAIIAALRQTRDALRTDCAGLRPEERTSFAPARSFELAERYAALLAASACVNVWRHARTPFLADPAWLVVGLARLAERLTGREIPVHQDIENSLFEELVERSATHRSFDLDALPLYGTHPGKDTP